MVRMGISLAPGPDRIPYFLPEAGSAIAPRVDRQEVQKMKKTIAAIAVALSLIGCSNWNKYTPKGIDDTAIAEEIRKNQATDGITGMTVNVDHGSVTLKGDVKNSTDKQKAIDDARKVNGVTRVVDEISIKP
jgi:osmotically-inducible protein OsmY